MTTNVGKFGAALKILMANPALLAIGTFVTGMELLQKRAERAVENIDKLTGSMDNLGDTEKLLKLRSEFDALTLRTDMLNGKLTDANSVIKAGFGSGNINGFSKDLNESRSRLSEINKEAEKYMGFGFDTAEGQRMNTEFLEKSVQVLKEKQRIEKEMILAEESKKTKPPDLPETGLGLPQEGDVEGKGLGLGDLEIPDFTAATEARKKAIEDHNKWKLEEHYAVEQMQLEMQEETANQQIAIERLRLEKELAMVKHTAEFEAAAKAKSLKKEDKIREDFSKRAHDVEMQRRNVEIQAMNEKLDVGNASLGLAKALIGNNKNMIPVLTTIKLIEIAIAAARVIGSSVSNPAKAAAGLGIAAGATAMLTSLSSGGNVPGSPGEPVMVMAHGGERIVSDGAVTHNNNYYINNSPNTTLTGEGANDDAILGVLKRQPEQLVDILKEAAKMGYSLN